MFYAKFKKIHRTKREKNSPKLQLKLLTCKNQHDHYLRICANYIMRKQHVWFVLDFFSNIHFEILAYIYHTDVFTYLRLK